MSAARDQSMDMSAAMDQLHSHWTCQQQGTSPWDMSASMDQLHSYWTCQQQWTIAGHVSSKGPVPWNMSTAMRDQLHSYWNMSAMRELPWNMSAVDHVCNKGPAPWNMSAMRDQLYSMKLYRVPLDVSTVQSMV